MSRNLRLAATAKLNLSLALGPRQPDGFHAIDTIFHSIALHDDVGIEVENGNGHITLEVEGDPSLPADPSNLAWRAAAALLGDAPFDVHLTLVKRIPSGAGLGGGSGDAAAVLLGLNALLPDPVLDTQLLSLATELGSDVPFALRGGTARGRGRGHLLTTLPSPAGWHFVVVQPPFTMQTAWCYQEWSKEARPLDAWPAEALTQVLMEGDVGSMKAYLYNDFEPIAFAHHPLLATIKQRLLAAGCQGALLTGSGSCLFGLVQSNAEANAVAEKLADLPVKILLTHSRDSQSP